MTRPLTDLTHRLAAVIGTALVLQFFSEFYFLNEGPATMASRGLPAVGEMAEFAAWYMLFAYVFLIVIDRFDLRSLAGLMLAGSIFGWATEALVVPVVYEAPPVSFIWPSVSWHALIDVALGWFALRLAMRRLTWPWLVLLFAGLGVVWAFWASWTWGSVEETPTVFTTFEFWTIMLVSGASWVIGTMLADVGARWPFHARLWEVAVIGLFTLVMFVDNGWPFLPWSAALGLLVALTIGALTWAKRGHKVRPDIFAPLAARPPLAAYLAMPVLPLAAGLTYPVVLQYNLVVPASEVTALLFLAGTLGFVWALVRSALDGFAP